MENVLGNAKIVFLADWVLSNVCVKTLSLRNSKLCFPRGFFWEKMDFFVHFVKKMFISNVILCGGGLVLILKLVYIVVNRMG